MEGRQRVIFHVLLVVVGTAVFCLTGFGAIRYNELYHPFASFQNDNVEVYDHDRTLRDVVDQLPQCAHSCMVNELTNIGCAHSDYKCMCQKLQQLDKPLKRDGKREPGFETCMASCSDSDQWMTPALFLDMCHATNVRAVLPKFMLQVFKYHGRRQLNNGTQPVFNTTAFFSSAVASVTSAPLIITTTLTDPSVRTRTTTTLSNEFATIAYVLVPLSLNTNFPSMSGINTDFNGALSSALSSASALLSGFRTTSRSVSRIASATSGLSTPTSFTGSGSFVSPSRKKKKGLGTGALAGIVIGAVLILIIVGALIFFMKKKKAKKAAAAATDNGTSTLPPMAEVDGQDNQLPPAYHSPVVKDAGKITVTTPPPVIAEPERAHTAAPPPPANYGAYELSGNQTTHSGVTSATGGVASQYNDPHRQELSGVDSQPARNELPSTPAQAYATQIGRKPISPPPVSHNSTPPPWDRTHGSDYQTYSPSELGTSTVGSTVPASSVSNDDVRGMEEEMARIRAQKERLNELRVLEEREEQLRRNIEAKRGGNGT